MGEPQRTPVSATPSGAPLVPQEKAGTTPDGVSTPPPRLSRRDYGRLLVVAAAGATLGFLVGAGLVAEIHEQSIEFVLMAVISGAAVYFFLDPVKAMFLGEETGGESSEARTTGAAVMIALALVVYSAWEHSLGSVLQEFQLGLPGLEKVDGLLFAVLLLVVLGGIAVVITNSWVSGALHKPAPIATRKGAIVGMCFGLAAAALVGLYLLDHGLPHADGDFWIILWRAAAVLMAFLWFFGAGAVGGYVTDKGWHTHSLTGRIFRVLLFFSGAYLIVLFFLAHAFKVQQLHQMPLLPGDQTAQAAIDRIREIADFKAEVDTKAWLIVVALIFQNLGWAFGLHTERKILNSLDPLGFSPVEAPPPHSRKKRPAKHGIAVVGAAAASSESSVHNGALAYAEMKPEHPTEAAKDLLLKPKGDRLWAAVALVLTLVAAGLAFYAGSLRKDSDLLHEIQAKMQQDSGLQSSSLNVQSKGRVVTLSGAVQNQAEHQKAVREAAAVRGVKYVVDQIQVAPAAPAASTTAADSTAGAVAPATVPVAPVVPPPANPSISVDVSAGSGGAAGSAKQTAASAPKTASKPAAKKGLSRFLPGNNNQASSSTQNASSQNQADTQKKGFLSRLFKKKDDNNNKNKNTKTTNQKTPNQ